MRNKLNLNVYDVLALGVRTLDRWNSLITFGNEMIWNIKEE